MTDKSIITLKEPKSGFSGDFELQTDIRIEELKVSLNKALISSYPSQFAGANGIELIYQNEKIPDDDTLASKGIWDGSVLELEVRR